MYIHIFLSILYTYIDVGDCQKCGPVLGILNTRCRIIIGTQKGTIILTTTQYMPLSPLNYMNSQPGGAQGCLLEDFRFPGCLPKNQQIVSGDEGSGSSRFRV